MAFWVNLGELVNKDFFKGTAPPLPPHLSSPETTKHCFLVQKKLSIHILLRKKCIINLKHEIL